MYQYDDPTAAATLPTPAAPGTAGYFTDGSPGTGTPATILRSDFTNMMMLELLNVVEGAGETPSKTTYNQVFLAIQKMIASLSPGVIGSARNLKCTNLAASAGTTLTYTADNIVVGTALGGLQSVISSLNATLNGATSGAINGLDTGALAASTSYAIYAALNPSTGTSGLLATLEPSTGATTTYTGSHPITGYTETALVGVWLTNSSSQFIQAFQHDRHVTTASLAGGVFTSALSNASVTLLVPYSAWRVEMGVAQTTTSSATNYLCTLASSSPVNGGSATLNATLTGTGFQQYNQNGYVDILTPRTCFCTWTVVGGASPQLVFAIAGYWF